MKTLSNQFKSPTTELYHQALDELVNKGPAESKEYQDHQSYIETLIARIEEDAKIDKIENHPAVSGVWRDSQTFIFGATLLHGYEYHGEGYITSDNAEDILEALKGVERS